MRTVMILDNQGLVNSCDFSLIPSDSVSLRVVMIANRNEESSNRSSSKVRKDCVRKQKAKRTQKLNKRPYIQYF